MAVILHRAGFLLSSPMLSQHSWHRPPALEIPAKSGSLAASSEGLLAAGALSPDVQPNTPPSLIPDGTPSSLLKIGSYLLTERLADLTVGIAAYSAVRVDTGERFTCRVLPLDRSRTALLPFSAVGSHPHINTPAEVIVGASSVYLMHQVSRDATEDLHAYMRRKRRLSEREAARLFVQALEAVAHCHRHNIVVRDVKLRHFLFIDADRTVLQLDGLYDAVVFTGSDDLLTDKHGCLAYVSPEILDATFSSGGSATATAAVSDPRTGRHLCHVSVPTGSYSGRPADMWSLGVMLYTMLVGRYPFADPDACTLFARIRRGRYPMPSEVSLSAPARCLVRSLLAINPADRLTAEEALRHPWFSAVESIPLTPAVSNQASDDGIVPQLVVEKVDDIFVE